MTEQANQVHKFLLARPFLVGTLGGCSLGLAWCFPGTELGCVFGLAAAFFLVLAVRTTRPYFSAATIGIVSHSLAFHWLAYTIKDFGGLSLLPTFVIFLLFVTLSSLQFIGFSFLFRHLPPKLEEFGLRTGLAWIAAEVIRISIFPWDLGHILLPVTPIALAASIGGTTLLSILLCSSLEVGYTSWRRMRLMGRVGFLAVGAIIITFGIYQETAYYNEKAPYEDLALVQANISIEEKHNVKLFEKNVERYTRLTEELVASGYKGLVLWPESIILDWTPVFSEHVRRIPHLPYFSNDVALVTGALTFEDRETLHNSALLIQPDGSIPVPYHKQVLMPFGEYTPFASVFPFLKALNPTAGDFSAGSGPQILRARVRSSWLNLGPLICYEDVVPELSRSATLAGAELLVNVTNDGWFGRSVASRQHHLIASFRAIENNRYLARATNTGYTAMVNPLGKTTASIEPYGEGSVIAQFRRGQGQTIYTKYVGELPWKFIAALLWLLALFKVITKKRKLP